MNEKLCYLAFAALESCRLSDFLDGVYALGASANALTLTICNVPLFYPISKLLTHHL